MHSCLEDLTYAQTKSMQKPLRLSRDVDGRTDRQMAFQLIIVDVYIYIYIYIRIYIYIYIYIYILE